MIRMTNISKNDFALVVNLFLVKGFREFRFDLSLDNFIFKWRKPWLSTIFNILKKDRDNLKNFFIIEGISCQSPIVAS